MYIIEYATSHYDTIEFESGPFAPLISSSIIIRSFIVSKTELLSDDLFKQRTISFLIIVHQYN